VRGVVVRSGVWIIASPLSQIIVKKSVIIIGGSLSSHLPPATSPPNHRIRTIIRQRSTTSNSKITSRFKQTLN
jgi:hypothetical protein